MAESVDALVSNTSGAIHPGSTPGLGTLIIKEAVLYQQDMIASFLFGSPLVESLKNLFDINDSPINETSLI